MKQDKTQILSRHNLKLRDCLDQNPSAYLGMTVPDFPNFFFIFGPNTVLAHSSVIWMIECQVRINQRPAINGKTV